MWSPAGGCAARGDYLDSRRGSCEAPEGRQNVAHPDLVGVGTVDENIRKAPIGATQTFRPVTHDLKIIQ